MSAKNLDGHGRWRSKTVAFRITPEEDLQLETAVRLSGLTKQDYITHCLLNHHVVVQGNPRVYKALKEQMAALMMELQRIEAGERLQPEMLETINLIATVMDGMKQEPPAAV